MKMKGQNFSLILILGALTASAGVPDGYYDSLTGLTGKSLRQAAAKIVKQHHTAISYGTNTWEAFEKTDVHLVNGVPTWWDMYSSNNVSVASGHPGMNIEHSVANSWWGGTKNDAYKDIVHLNPSNIDANSRKSNYPLGEIGTLTWDNGVTFVGKPVSGQGGGSNMVYEPADEYKGDFARVFMYMFTTYENISWQDKYDWMYNKGSDDFFNPWAIELLLKWHRQDPVSQKEIDRNNAIYEVQHSRNPFVDSPELAEYVWGSKKGSPYSFTGDYVPGDDPDPTPGPGDDPIPDPVPNPGKEGTWSIVESITQIIESGEYIIVGGEEFFGMSINDYTGGTNTYAYSTSSMQMEVIEGAQTISTPAADIAVLHLERQSDNTHWRARITDLKNQQIGWLACQGAKKIRYLSAPTDECDFTLSINGGVANLSFGSNKGSLYYNASHPRFTTYTAPQTAISLFCYNPENNGDISTVVTLPASPDDEGLRVFNIQGVEVDSDLNNADPGLYILVSPGKRPRKIRII